jgi:hypothetical protein
VEWGGHAVATCAGVGRYGGAATGWAERRGRAVRAYWASRTKDWPRRPDPANRGAAVAKPARARALWSARVPTPLSLALFDH